jgi:hypothetical protein
MNLQFEESATFKVLESAEIGNGKSYEVITTNQSLAGITKLICLAPTRKPMVGFVGDALSDGNFSLFTGNVPVSLTQ